MKRYSDKALTAMLDDLESDVVERKRSFSGDTPKKAREVVCAFCNDLADRRQQGVLFIGVEDNGNPELEFEVNPSVVLCTFRKAA